VNSYLRPVTIDDAKLLFEWRNEEECRKNSFHSEPVTWEEHVNWLQRKLVSPDTKMYIFTVDSNDVGQIRLEAQNGEYMISYSVAAEYRLMGYGSRMLMLAEKSVYETKPGAVLCAEVKKDNIASQVLFEKLNYTKKDLGEHYEYQKNAERYEKSNEDLLNKSGGVLLLTNNENALSLYEWLCEHEERVLIFSGKLNAKAVLRSQPDIIVSYNYKYILGPDVIEAANKNIINLHISYLPCNKGSQPNFWSFMENTPKGVSIHQLEAGLDKGALLCQKQMEFDESIETFSSTYTKLNDAIVKLLEDNWDDIRNQRLESKPQMGKGTYHDMKQFMNFTKENPVYWDEVIGDYKKRCGQL
jgi:methionyl-tRNA formyltransferase